MASRRGSFEVSTEEFGKYRIERRLAAGGWPSFLWAFSREPKASNVRLRLSGFFLTSAADPAFQSMFWDEATLAANLSHPNIVRF